jgi:PQQ-dependent dehydrogenase (methanol/ethanol family)
VETVRVIRLYVSRIAWLLAVALVGSSAATEAQPRDASGDWPMAARDYANTRFSPLEQITTANASSLKLAFTFSTGVLRGHEAAPIVVGSTMYIVTPYPNIVYALDLAREGAPVKWKFEPRPSASAQGAACCDVVNRGVAYADGRIFFNTLDNHTIALDAASGREVWRTKLGEIRNGESMTMAPLVVKDKVLVGNSGGEYGVRGWLTALDARSGRIAWRAYSTGPDRDVLIGADFKPFYSQDHGSDLGTKTWPGEAWKIGGGTVWGFVSYDPELDLIYYGTGNPGPWNAEQRPGPNKFTAGTFARRPSDGQARWFYQWKPSERQSARK